MQRTHSTAWQRRTAILLALLWLMPVPVWAEASSAADVTRHNTSVPLVAEGSPPLPAPSDRGAFGWLTPFIAPVFPALSRTKNRGYVNGTAGRIRFEVESASPSLAPRLFNSMAQLYHYTPRRVEGRLELLNEVARYKRYRLTFPSLLRDRFSAGGTVYAEYYEPKGHATFPAVIVLPHVAGDATIEQLFCRGLANHGIGALIVFAPYYRTELGSLNWLRASKNPTDLVEIIQLMRESVTVVRQSIDWLQQQPNVQPASFGIIGVSLGGIVAALTAGLDPRLQVCEYLLAGGDVSRLIWQSHLTQSVKATAKQHGFTAGDLHQLLMLIDPLSVAEKARTKQTFMINALFDLTVPRSCTLELWRALGNPNMLWLPTEHATALLLAPYLRWRTVRYFEQAFGAAPGAAGSARP